MASPPKRKAPLRAAKTKAKPKSKAPSKKVTVVTLAINPAPIGRPRLYSPKYAKIAYGMAKWGATDFDICQRLGIHVDTLRQWSAEYPDFSDALKVGKKPADDRVVRSLFHRANGYDYVEEEIRVVGTQVVRVQVRKHMPPSETAAKMWLLNRRPGEWRDKVTVEHTVDDSLRAWMIRAAAEGDVPALDYDDGDVLEGEFSETEPADRDINPDDFDSPAGEDDD